jgi:hypothetical protein
MNEKIVKLICDTIIGLVVLLLVYKMAVLR